MRERKQLGEVCFIHLGEQLNRDTLTNDGVYPVINGGKNPSGYTDKFNEKGGTVTIAQGGAAGFVNWIDRDFWAGAHCYVLEPVDGLNKRYFFHLLKENEIEIQKKSQGAGIPGLKKTDLLSHYLVISSRTEQDRIVSILDTFYHSIDNLRNQIKQRRIQSEYYRDQLIDFGSNDKNETYKLGTICAIGDGIHGTPTYNDNGEYYFVNGNNLSNGQIFLKPDTKKVDDTMYYKYGIEFDSRTILMSINGTIGNIALYNNEKIILGKSAAYFKIKRNDIMYFRYLYYMLQTSFSKNYYNESLTGSTIKNLGLKALRCFDVFVPSLSEQQRIVSILDTFEASISNLEAQLKQREKQYEYYRNKLLTFE